MGIEYEVKFRADRETQTAIREAYAGLEQEFSMHTTYYDTPSGSLSARYYTLRRRMENEQSICTLKAPISGCGRGEWETVCDCISDAIEELCKLGAPKDLPVLAAEGLLAVCGAKFNRLAKTVTLEAATFELALDEGILYGGGKELPLCEVEVELKNGEPSACIAFAQSLAEQFSLEPEEKSKFRRALALYQGE